MSAALKRQARALYKELHYMGREYPDPAYNFNKRLHQCFLSHVGADDEKVKAGIAKAAFIKKELEAMYYLRKYRHLRKRYDEEAQQAIPDWEKLSDQAVKR